MSHTIYCDRCGRESRSDVEPHEERNILPGPAEGQEEWRSGKYELEFIRLDEHRETTGDRIWCGRCWDEVTASEVSPVWKNAFEAELPGFVDLLESRRLRKLRHKHRHWYKARCLECRQWLEVPRDCPTVETTRYTVLLGTAGEPIDGWFYGVLFEDGKPLDVRCPTHVIQKAA